MDKRTYSIFEWLMRTIRKLMNSRFGLTVVIMIILMQVGVAFLVYYTGGIQYVYSHSMYVPIIIAAIFLGLKGGLLSGLFGGFLLGPYMPVNVEGMLMQDPLNWLFRMVIFTVIGLVTSYFIEKIRSYYQKEINQYRYLLNTDILLINQMYKDLDLLSNEEMAKQAMIHVKILKFDQLIDFLGDEGYLNVLKQVRKNIQTNIEQSKVYAKDINGLSIVFSKTISTQAVNIVKKMTNRTYTVSNVPVFLECSIGVSEGQVDAEDLMKKASIASRIAEKNKLEHVIFDQSIKDYEKDIHLLGSVNQAIKNDEFTMVYQPQYDLKTGNIVGVEALIRWTHPTFGKLSPGYFIPLIEQTSLINPLTEWVIDHVLKKLSMYREEFDPSIHPISMNISTSNLFYESFFQMVKDKLDQYDFQCQDIKFEITESLLMKNPLESIKILESFSNYDISLSLDDFGTGYSSLSYLSRFPVNEIKIDRTFILRMKESKEDLTIIKSAIDLARGLNLTSVAEGVETKEEYELLKQFNCDRVQGYFFAKPMPFEDLLSYIQKQPS